MLCAETDLILLLQKGNQTKKNGDGDQRRWENLETDNGYCKLQFN